MCLTPRPSDTAHCARLVTRSLVRSGRRPSHLGRRPFVLSQRHATPIFHRGALGSGGNPASAAGPARPPGTAAVVDDRRIDQSLGVWGPGVAGWPVQRGPRPRGAAGTRRAGPKYLPVSPTHSMPLRRTVDAALMLPGRAPRGRRRTQARRPGSRPQRSRTGAQEPVAERSGRPRRRRGVPVPRPHRRPPSRAGVTRHGRSGRDGQHRDPDTTPRGWFTTMPWRLRDAKSHRLRDVHQFTTTHAVCAAHPGPFSMAA